MARHRSWSQYWFASSRQTASAARPAMIRGQRLPKGARFASGAFMAQPYPLTAEGGERTVRALTVSPRAAKCN